MGGGGRTAAAGDGCMEISEEEKNAEAGWTPAPRRFAVLLCAEESDFVKMEYGSCLQVFAGLLEEEGETWHIYRAVHRELPRDEDVDGYDGFVITGSISDAHGEEQWIQELIAFLRALDAKKKKVLGICFGHQILCRALGGKTGRATRGWDIGVTCINLSPSAMEMLSSLRLPSRLPLIEVHQDEILQLPARAEVLACSEKTGIEMFRCGDHFMGIQGHPECNKSMLLHLVDRLLGDNLIQDSQAEAAKESLDKLQLDRESWERLCKSFLKGKLLQPEAF